MARHKKAARGRQAVSNSDEDRDMPSDACKAFLIECIARFYEAESTMSLENKYLRYQEECPVKFKLDMTQRMLDALSVPRWYNQMEKRGFQQFLNNRVHDALWNAKSIVEKYGRQHRANDEAFEQVIVRVDLFVQRCAPFAKKRNRRGSLGWWNSTEGVEELQRGRRHLIALPETARVIQQDDRIMRGGYATIRRVRIEGCPGIAASWEFAAKKSNHHRTQPQLAKMEHQNESMAVRIPHSGVIRFVAVHATTNEGYSYWWNGGTLRQMLNLDSNFPRDINMRLLHCNPTEKEVVEAFRLGRFRKKRTELAWALVHIMNEVHSAGHLHNDLSPDNIMLHFPEDESRVYIGVCDWGMTTLATDPMKSLYTFTSESERDETLRRRWWLDPAITYVHKKDADVEIIPYLSRATEEYAVGKIAQRIQNEEMSVHYFNLQGGRPGMCKFQHHELGTVFQLFLDRLCQTGPRGLAHVITFFTTKLNWPVPDEHFRHLY